MVTVANRVSRSERAIVKQGYLYRPGGHLPIPLGTESFEYWVRHNKSFRVVIPDGTNRWVGAKKDKGLIVLQKRVNKRLFCVSCGRGYSLRFRPPDFLEKRAIDLSGKIGAIFESWDNRSRACDAELVGPVKQAPKIFTGKPDKRVQAEYQKILNEGELEYLILSLGQGYQFTAELFYTFLEKEWPLSDIKLAIRRQVNIGNIIRRPNGYYCVTE